MSFCPMHIKTDTSECHVSKTLNVLYLELSPQIVGNSLSQCAGHNSRRQNPKTFNVFVCIGRNSIRSVDLDKLSLEELKSVLDHQIIILDHQIISLRSVELDE